MPTNWIAVRVTLLGGAGIENDPPPGRTMIVGPRHSFADFAEAIDQAFARWDLSHLHVFRLPDGGLVGEASAEWDEDVLDETSLKVVSTVGAGDLFDYIFDLGDEWRHSCEVEATDVDPMDVYGIAPRTPVPIWGWGWIPDQYGRRTPDGDGDEEWQVRWVKTSDNDA